MGAGPGLRISSRRPARVDHGQAAADRRLKQQRTVHTLPFLVLMAQTPKSFAALAPQADPTVTQAISTKSCRGMGPRGVSRVLASGHKSKGAHDMIQQLITQFWKEEDGASAIEYSLLAALIAVAIIAGATALGTSIGSLFTQVGTKIAAVKP